MKPFIEALRPAQWIKNGFVFAVALFAGRILQPHPFLASLIAFVAFCAASSATYLFNDLRDLQGDRNHPIKKSRPLASGRLGVGSAWIGAVVLAVLGLSLAAVENPSLAIVVGAYLAIQVFYSLASRRWVIADVMTLAAGFVLRVIAGGVATGIPFSNWILICTFLLALFLGFGKRRHELVLLEGEAGAHRSSLSDYGIDFLDQILSVVGSATAVVYMIYATSGETVERFGKSPVNMTITVPFVLYGLFRYFFLVHQRGGGGNPTRELLTDRPLLVAVGLYVMTVLSLYLFHPALRLP